MVGNAELCAQAGPGLGIGPLLLEMLQIHREGNHRQLGEGEALHSKALLQVVVPLGEHRFEALAHAGRGANQGIPGLNRRDRSCTN